MTLPLQTSLPLPGQSSIDRLRQSSGKGLEAEKVRLRKATKEFEAFFMYQMMKTMRQTTLAPDKGKDTGPISGDLGKDEFTQMFDMELTRHMATGEKNSIADMLYRSLVKQLDAEYSDPGNQTELKPIALNSGLLKIENGTRMMPTKPANILKPILRPEKLLPISAGKPKISTGSITERFGKIIAESARKTGLDPNLIRAVIQTESGGDPKAVSPKGAKGLMQLTDSTAADLGVNDVFDPKANIEAGSRYLRRLVDRFGDLRLALAAYNAGPANVDRFGGVPPFSETKQYIKKVLARVSGK